MQLKEIELDLPYEVNYNYIEKIAKERMLSIDDASIEDYENNWKEKRIRFRLNTRCMTSMIERLIFPIKGMSFWKILIECVRHKTYDGYKNLLGVCVIQYEFNYADFYDLSDEEKKKQTVKIVLNSLNEINELRDVYVKIKNSVYVIESNNYINRWYWNRKAKSGNNTAQLLIIHNVNEVELHIVITDKDKIIIDKIIATLNPDERAYMKFFGEIGWKSPNEVFLITKDNVQFTVSL